MSRISETIPHPTERYRNLRLEAENVHEFLSLREEAEARVPVYFTAPTEEEAVANIKAELGAVPDPPFAEGTDLAKSAEVSDAKAAFLKSTKGA